MCEQAIRRFQQGDKQAFQQIYEQYYKRVYYLALKISRNQADAKDIAQDTFVQMQKSLIGLKDPKLFDQWMHRIVISKASDLFRKNKTSSFPEEHAVFQVSKEERNYMLPEANMHMRSDQEVLKHFLEQLDEKYQLVLLLSYFSNMKIRDIAKTLEIPEGTVKSRMNTGKEQLRELIENYQDKERVHLNFRTADMSVLLSGYFASEFAKTAIRIPVFSSSTFSLLKTKFTNKTWTYTMGIISASVLVVATIKGVELLNQSSSQNEVEVEQNKKPFGPIDYGNQTFDNAHDAYYALTLWAHCDVEMQTKSKTEILAIQPLYEELKKYEGIYWSMLCFRDWNEQFEKFLEKN